MCIFQYIVQDMNMYSNGKNKFSCYCWIFSLEFRLQRIFKHKQAYVLKQYISVVAKANIRLVIYSFLGKLWNLLFDEQ